MNSNFSIVWALPFFVPHWLLDSTYQRVIPRPELLGRLQKEARSEIMKKKEREAQKMLVV